MTCRCNATVTFGTSHRIGSATVEKLGLVEAQFCVRTPSKHSTSTTTHGGGGRRSRHGKLFDKYGDVATNDGESGQRTPFSKQLDFNNNSCPWC